MRHRAPGRQSISQRGYDTNAAMFPAAPTRLFPSRCGHIGGRRSAWRPFARAAFLALVLSTSSCFDCGSNQETVERIEALSPQRIEKLAADMKALAASASADPNGIRSYDEKTGIPPEFSDLKPRGIRVSAPSVSMHLSGCVDDKAMVILSDTGDEQWLTLHRGEAKEPKMLWRSDPAMRSQAPD